MKKYLTVEETKLMLGLICRRIVENEPLLTKIDTAIGDCDHGIGMKRGFEALLKDLGTYNCPTINELFRETGMSLLKAMGGASGVLFSTLFTGGLINTPASETLTTQFISDCFCKSFEVMKKRGRSEENRKTMLDAVGPATRELAICAKETAPFSQSIGRAAQKAYEGSMMTCKMIAGHGRARKLGKGSIGTPDPGAISVYIIFAAMDEYVNGTKLEQLDF